MQRIGLLVHPTRSVDRPLTALRAWTTAHGAELVTLAAPTGAAPPAGADGCDVIVAIGGDGTVLTALRAALGPRIPVLGVACGSLGALTAVPGDEVPAALDRFAAGDWIRRTLPTLTLTDGDEGLVARAVNDVVLIRRGTAQLIVAVTVGDELYARVAGDGVIVATPLGSSAYSMAAGGPLLLETTAAYLCTPLATHGGSAPPLVVPAGTPVTLDAQPGFGGFDLEVDGRRIEPAATRFTVRLEPDGSTLVRFDDHERGLAGLRSRHLIADSPRVIARDGRAGR